jgi:reversion-inducing cysteine-rich kazal motif protein
MLYSIEYTDVASSKSTSGPVTVSDILNILSQQLMVKECDVFGYLNVETDLVVLVKPVTASPTKLQVKTTYKNRHKCLVSR